MAAMVEAMRLQMEAQAAELTALRSQVNTLEIDCMPVRDAARLASRTLVLASPREPLDATGKYEREPDHPTDALELLTAESSAEFDGLRSSGGGPSWRMIRPPSAEGPGWRILREGG